jgi:uncharacterized membrane protein HdeD (DUF308 family)
MGAVALPGSPALRHAADLQLLARNWWIVAARGIAAVVLGCMIAIWHDPSFTTAIASFGVYAILDGLLAIASALRAAGRRSAGWPIALEGMASVVLGVIALTWPMVPPRVINTLIVWGLLTGLLEIIAALGLPRDVAAHWLVGTAGVSSIFLALALLALPQTSSERVLNGLAIYAIVFGIALVLAALRFRLAVGPRRR